MSTNKIESELLALRELFNETIDGLISEVRESQIEAVRHTPSLIEDDTRRSILTSAGTERIRSTPFKRRPRFQTENEVEEMWQEPQYRGEFVSPRLLASRKFEGDFDAIEYYASSWNTACAKFFKEGKMERKSMHGMNYYKWVG